MNLIVRLALATDEDIDRALKVMMKGLTIERKEIDDLVSDEKAFRKEMARALPASVKLETSAKGREVQLLRAIAVDLAGNRALAARLDKALSQGKKLIEPVTTLLVLAGIVMVLSTNIEFEHSNKGGKRSTKIVLRKKSTSDAILKKFFDLKLFK